MATEPHSETPQAGELSLPTYAAWSPNELQAKLAEIGAPTQGEWSGVFLSCLELGRSVLFMFSYSQACGDPESHPEVCALVDV